MDHLLSIVVIIVVYNLLFKSCRDAPHRLRKTSKSTFDPPNNSSSNSISSNTPTSSVYLRVSKYASVIAFHYSLDNDNGNNIQQQQNQYWTLHRVFSMRNINKIPMSIGFLAQAPVGPDSCTAVFSEIHYSPQKTLQNLRDGS